MRQSSTHSGDAPARRTSAASVPEQPGPLDRENSPAAQGTGDGGDSTGDEGGRGGGRRRRPRARPRRRRYRILAWTAGVLAVLILGTAGAGYLYYQHLNGNIRKDSRNLGDHDIPPPEPNAFGQTPLNILLIGSDARDSKENQDLGGAKETFGGTPLADVQMLVHLSADRSNMSVISMPRDTLVQIPRCTEPDGTVHEASTGRAMTNTSLGRGGPGCTVATWQDLTGIHIDHFMMVDFSGVVSMADAIGGVPVCVDANIHSRDAKGHGSGLKLRKGTHDIKGEQALQWLRTRYGFEDNTDIGRAKAQHMYMNSLVRQLRQNSSLGSPGKLRSLAEEATKSLTVDEGLGTVKKLYDLSGEFKRIPPDRVTMTTMPWQTAVSDKARVEPKPGDAEQLFRLVREDIALDGKDKERKPAPKQTPADDEPAPDPKIAVQVQNGTRSVSQPAVQGRAGEIARILTGKGFTGAVADPSVLPAQDRTLIRFPSADLEGDARQIAKTLGLPDDAVKQSTAVSGVTVLVGADWREGTKYEKAPALSDDKVPGTADALNGSNDKACMHVNPSYTF